MPKAKQATMRIEVIETTGADTRTIVVTITAPSQDFLLTDLLRQRGAVGSLEIPLKQAVSETVQSYLEGTEDLIAGIAAGQKKATNGAKPKPKETTNGQGNGAVNGVNGQAVTMENDEAADEVLMLQ